MSDPVIELKGLKKDYGNGRGVFDVSFSVERGEVFGFLGPNGAGKTVTMRNLMGFIRPDEGTVSIDGLNCFSQRSRIQERLGYLPGEIACMDEMTGAAFLEFMARMKKLRDRTRMNQLVEYFELDPARRIRKMSKGTKQKVGLVCAFMTSPDIVLLDEPTSGLDPLMQSRFIDLVLEEKRRGATILLSSHLFDEVERTCDRFAQAHPDARKQGAASVEAAVAGNPDAFVKDLAAYDIVDLSAREQTLEELFMHLYGTTNQVEKGGSHE